MRNYHLRRNSKWCPTLNLDKLWTLVSEQTRLKYKDHPEGKAPVIDIIKAVSILMKFYNILNSLQLKSFQSYKSMVNR